MPAATALTAAASLLAAAALVEAADTTGVSVSVSETDISIQIGRHAGDPAVRAAAVAAYAGLLHTTVTRTPARHSPGSRVETHAVLAGHPVHVWTFIDPPEPLDLLEH
ncbi:hypothetical protein ABT297_19470 [Dactylosporangium sp. NPDC000555]|uniref:hypothetical protein n=1 Tax=Dactylosporangium sp. NPDC000555 TaxID=3154260 RepID=UPI00331A0CEE